MCNQEKSTMKKVVKQYFWMIFIAILAACGNIPLELTAMPLPTITSTPLLPTPTSTLEVISVTVTPSPLPTQPIVALTPDAIQVKRWKEYEAALAKTVFRPDSPEHALCEWEILGRSDQEVYVWAVCNYFQSNGSLPAVIYLDADGAILSVVITSNIPMTYSEAINKLFPIDVREKFRSIDVSEMLTHLEWRQTHPEVPPLIVLSATPMP
jgi:hypothetical protein